MILSNPNHHTKTSSLNTIDRFNSNPLNTLQRRLSFLIYVPLANTCILYPNNSNAHILTSSRFPLILFFSNTAIICIFNEQKKMENIVVRTEKERVINFKRWLLEDTYVLSLAFLHIFQRHTLTCYST
jgi:hypothetical protein